MNILDKVRQPENRKLELKRSLPPRAKWLKSIIAFANGADQGAGLGLIINCFRTNSPVPYVQSYISHGFFS